MTMASAYCTCRCHNALRGSWEGACQLGLWHKALEIANDPRLNASGWADVADPLEAAVAQGCTCLCNHSVALSDDVKPWGIWGTPWSVEKDVPEQSEQSEGGET